MRRTVDPTAGIRKLRRERCCRVCGSVPPGSISNYLQRMHVVPRSLGGDDVDDNLVPGCSYCHAVLTDGRRIEGHLPPADVFRLFTANLTESERAYAASVKGTEWLAIYYGSGWLLDGE